MRIFMERYTGLEPATSTLARLRSTRWANTAKKWRLRWDSNPRPPPWQGGVLTNWTTKPFLYSTAKNAASFKKWWELQGSNLWPSVCKTDALPAELNSHIVADISTALICYHIHHRLSIPATKKILTILKTHFRTSECPVGGDTFQPNKPTYFDRIFPKLLHCSFFNIMLQLYYATK